MWVSPFLITQPFNLRFPDDGSSRFFANVADIGDSTVHQALRRRQDCEEVPPLVERRKPCARVRESKVEALSEKLPSEYGGKGGDLADTGYWAFLD